MQKRRLGQTDIHVSVLGLGTVKFGRNQNVKYPHAFQLPTESELVDLLSYAQDMGINLLDTAPAYGSSETRLGKLLATRRQDWIIVTKVGEQFSEGVSYFDFSYAGMQKSIDESLLRLNTDYLDIVLVHSNGQDVHLIEHEAVFEVLKANKIAGKIRAFGMSTKTISGGMMTLDHADVAMVTYNKAYTKERSVIDYGQKKQKGILVKKALQSGHLEATSAKEALQFVLAQPSVSSIVIGTINKAHLREHVENVASLSLLKS